MVYLSDVAEFRRRKGSKNRYKKVKKDDYKDREERRAEINNNRKVVGTGVGVVRETRGWLNLIRAFA
jgi:hypothetical protein